METLLTTNQSIFSVDDLATLWEIPDRANLWEVIKYYTRTNRLHRIQRGIYALSNEYPPLEAAIKIQTPSYLTYTTALAFHGLLYQYSSEIHLMAPRSKQIQLPTGHLLIYHQLKNDILLNQIGLMQAKGIWIASPERAVCDTTYLEPSFVFENIEKLKIGQLESIALIFNNKKLLIRIQQLIEDIKELNNA